MNQRGKNRKIPKIGVIRVKRGILRVLGVLGGMGVFGGEYRLF
jgi:hypothetical protein